MKLLFSAAIIMLIASGICFAKAPGTIYTYTLKDDGTQRSYDETIAVACFQGILNRNTPTVWINAEKEKHADVWQKIMSEDGRWLADKKWIQLNSLDELRKLAGSRIKGAIIWDPAVPATVNVGNTIAGVEDLVLLSPEFADKYLKSWNLTVKHDLRGKFDGSETGSAKNDAYRWAIREYLAKGKCSKKFIFLNVDAWKDTRDKGVLPYVMVRDWAIANRGFVYDLSPWGDELPQDDLNQPLGTDLATYKMLLQTVLDQTNGKSMTEMAGFFDFAKYSSFGGGKHHPVGTEWQTVYLLTPYNVYQNTADHNCYNKSFHKHFDFKPLKQKINKNPKVKLENKTYVCILMADFDSATPLYVFMPGFWSDPRRGEVPMSWGINPNLINTYPDVIDYYYKTATKNDYFVADATCAGYFNPTRVQPKYMDLFIKHNKKYYDLLDMDISPMVLDVAQPTSLVKDAFTKFSAKGYGSMIGDWQGTGATDPEPQIWKGMPLTVLKNTADNFLREEYKPEDFAKWVSDNILGSAKLDEPNFAYLRIVWCKPGNVIDGIDALKKQRPDLNIEVVDPYSFFELQKQYHVSKNYTVIK